LDTTTTKCATREAIKQVFGDRHLVTLPCPHNGRSHKLEQQTLNPKFEKFLTIFRNHVCTHAKPVSASGVSLTGVVYVRFLHDIVSKVNADNAIPKIEDSWTLVSKLQHNEEENKARQALIALALNTCPNGTEKQVIEWTQKQCQEYCKSLTFIPPGPDIHVICSRLVSDIVEQCGHAGKIKSLEQTARD